MSQLPSPGLSPVPIQSSLPTETKSGGAVLSLASGTESPAVDITVEQCSGISGLLETLELFCEFSIYNLSCL